MIPTVNDIVEELFSWAPRALAEEWDNVGLQVGFPFWPVNKAAIALDITPFTLAFALEIKADIVISHHPLIFTPLKRLDLNETTARLLAGFLRHEISVVSVHTNLDVARGGVNDKLAALLGLVETQPLVPNSAGGDAGLGRAGFLPEPLSEEEFLSMVSSVLDISCLGVAGRTQEPIRKVALCAGSGSSLFHEAVKWGVQAFVSAEIKHSVAREAEALGIMAVDAGHFNTERPIVHDISSFLTNAARKRDWELDAIVFEREASPIRFWNRQ